MAILFGSKYCCAMCWTSAGVTCVDAVDEGGEVVISQAVQVHEAELACKAGLG